MTTQILTAKPVIAQLFPRPPSLQQDQQYQQSTPWELFKALQFFSQIHIQVLHTISLLLFLMHENTRDTLTMSRGG